MFGTSPSSNSDHSPNDGDISVENSNENNALISAPQESAPPPEEEEEEEVSQESAPEDQSSPDVVVVSGESSGEVYVCSATPPEDTVSSSEEDVAELKSVYLNLMEDYYDSDWEKKVELTAIQEISQEEVSKEEEEAGPSKPKKPKKKEWVRTSFKLKSYLYIYWQLIGNIVCSLLLDKTA